jgi:hypothetical protein
VILAANFDAEYHAAHTAAIERQMPLWEVEREVLGASHAEIGAFLLDLWGMSADIVNVAAFHHDPLRSSCNSFTALTAVHAANALEYEEHPDPTGSPAPLLDAAYLQRLGLEKHVDYWRQAIYGPDAARVETGRHRAKSPRTIKAGQLPPAPAMPARWGKWLGIGLGVSAALVWLAWLAMPRLEIKPPVKHEIAAFVAPATAVHQEPRPAPAPPPLAPPVAVIPPPPASAPPAAPVPSPLDGLKLEMIFYSPQHPVARIDGIMAGVGAKVDECLVLDITASTVTLEYQHQRKTLTLE